MIRGLLRDRQVQAMALSTIGETIRALRKKRGYSQDELAELASLNRVTVAKYELGRVEPGAQALMRIAEALDVSADRLLGIEDRKTSPYIQIVEKSVPILGSIACGQPIFADENFDGYVSVPEGVKADYALLCKGDSMYPTLQDGDYVLIKQKPDVYDGQIAAVLIDDEATLKRVHHLPDGLVLNPDNQDDYSPIVLRAEDAANVRILGEAVYFVRHVKKGRIRQSAV